MQSKSRFRLILVGGLLIVLIGIAIFLAYDIYVNNQAPDDAAAGSSIVEIPDDGETQPVDPGPPEVTDEPECGDPGFEPGIGQCSPPGTETCSDTCEPILQAPTEDVPQCGDSDFEPGEGECANPGEQGCSENCEIITPTTTGNETCGNGELEADEDCDTPGEAVADGRICSDTCTLPDVNQDDYLSLAKTGSETCNDNTHILRYTVTITNISESTINISSITDQIPNSVTYIGGDFTAESIDSQIVLNSDALSLEPDASESLSYTLEISNALAANLDNIIQNVVTAYYNVGENSTSNRIEFTHRLPLLCTGSLPDTALEDDIMIYIALILIFLAIIIYRLPVLNQPLTQLISKPINASLLTIDRYYPSKKRGKKHFEHNLKKKQEK